MSAMSNQIKRAPTDSVAGGSASGKPFSIPQPLLEQLNKTKAPVKKPVVAPAPSVERMPKEQLEQLKEDLNSKQNQTSRMTLALIAKDFAIFHPADIAEYIYALFACKPPSLQFYHQQDVQLAAIPLIAKLPQEYHQELYNLAAACIKAVFNTKYEDCNLIAVSCIESLNDDSLKAACIKAAIESKYEQTQLRAFPLIESLGDDSLKADCIKALCRSRYEKVQLQAIPFISIIKDDSLKLTYITTACNSRYKAIQKIALKLAEQTYAQVQPSALSVAGCTAERIKAYLKSDYYLVQLKIILHIGALKDGSLKADCIKIALRSKHEDIQLRALDLIETLDDDSLKASCIAALNLNYNHNVRFKAIPLIANLPQEYQPALYKQAANTIANGFGASHFIQLKALSLIETLDDDSLKAHCITAALKNNFSYWRNYYGIKLSAFSLIETLNDDALKAACIKIALRSKHKAIQLKALPLIETLKDDALKAACIKTTLRSKYEDIQLTAIPLIDPLQGIRPSDGDTHKSDCISFAFISKFRSVRQGAFDLTKQAA